MKLKNIKGLLLEPCDYFTRNYQDGYNDANDDLGERELFDFLEVDEEEIIEIIGDWVNEVNTDIGSRYDWRLLAKNIIAVMPEIIRGKK